MPSFPTGVDAVGNPQGELRSSQARSLEQLLGGTTQALDRNKLGPSRLSFAWIEKDPPLNRASQVSS